jgi:hypothetical protein
VRRRCLRQPGRPDQHQPLDQRRLPHGEPERDRGAHRDAADDRPPQAEMAGERGEVLGEGIDRQQPQVAQGPRRPVAAATHRDQPDREAFAGEVDRLLRLGAEPMLEEEGRSLAPVDIVEGDAAAKELRHRLRPRRGAADGPSRPRPPLRRCHA